MNEREIMIFNNELYTIAYFLKSGIDNIRSIKSKNDFVLTCSIMMVAQGVERLLKIIYALGYYCDHKIFPTKEDFKGYGHGIVSLFDVLFNNIKSNHNDDFIKYSSIINKVEPYNFILEILNNYSSYSRYYNFDVLNSNSVQYSCAVIDWENKVQNFIENNDVNKISIYKKYNGGENCTKEIAEKFYRCDNMQLFINVDRYKYISKYNKFYICKLVQVLVVAVEYFAKLNCISFDRALGYFCDAQSENYFKNSTKVYIPT